MQPRWRYGVNAPLIINAVRVTRALLPSLLEQRGAIVNVSSPATRAPSAGPTDYAGAKAAVTAFGRALAEEVGPQGVRVDTVSRSLPSSPTSPHPWLPSSPAPTSGSTVVP